MKVSTLQLFLRSLRPAVTAAGANTSLPADLESVSAGLEPFASLDFSLFAAFLRQAEQYRKSGAVTVPSSSSLGSEKVHASVRGAASLAEKIAQAESLNEQQLTAEREKARQELEEAFTTFLKPLAINVTFKDDPKAFANALKSAKTKALVGRVRAVLDGVTDEATLNAPERQQRLHAVVDPLPLPDLKAVAMELNANATGKQDAIVSAIVEQMTGLRTASLKGKPKSPKPAADQAVVQQQAIKIKGLLEKSMDPGGLSSVEIEAAITELGSRPLPELKAIAKEVGLEKVGQKNDVILKQFREKLLEAEHARESIQV